jgi:hypothetical protein
MLAYVLSAKLLATAPLLKGASNASRRAQCPLSLLHHPRPNHAATGIIEHDLVIIVYFI